MGTITNFHHRYGMARPQAADGEDDSQMWRVDANILNKQSWTTDKRWVSNLGVGEELTTVHRKIILL
jgi:hypothetical protein